MSKIDRNNRKTAEDMLSFAFDMGEDEIVLRLQAPIPDSSSTLDSGFALEQLERSVEGCTGCPLASTRNKLVFGAGDPDADIMFVGEAPGADEDRVGEPFVGRAGKLLDRIFAAMGLSRSKGVYIGNILKCRPPKNRNPSPEEVESCMPILLRQIEIIRPKIICCLGRVAAQNLLNTDVALGRLRGRLHTFYPDKSGEGIPVLVTYHPAYLLRNPAGKRPVWEDMKRLLEVVGLRVEG